MTPRKRAPLDARTLLTKLRQCSHPVRQRIEVGDASYHNGDTSTLWCGACGAFAYAKTHIQREPAQWVNPSWSPRARRIERAAKRKAGR